MPFPWSNKVSRVIPAPLPETQVQVEQPVQEVVAPEPVQVVELPVVDDKNSSIEHKNGESLVSSHEKDDEAHEVQGDLQEGGRAEEGDCGSEEDLARVED